MPNYAKDRALRSPGQLMHTLEGGKFPSRVMEAQQKVTAELERLQGLGVRKPKGTITITLEMQYEDGLMEVRPKLTTKTPSPPSKKTPLFVNDDGSLTTSNPLQDEFDLKEVAPAPQITTDFDPATGEILDAKEG